MNIQTLIERLQAIQAFARDENARDLVGREDLFIILVLQAWDNPEKTAAQIHKESVEAQRRFEVLQIPGTSCEASCNCLYINLREDEE